MLVGSIVIRIRSTLVEIRLITPAIGERQHQRMISSFNAIQRSDFDLLANTMIALYSNFGAQDLRETEANFAFERHVGRGSRFNFRSFEMISSSEYRNQVEISIIITVGHRV